MVINWEVVVAGTESYLRRTGQPVDGYEIFETFDKAKAELISLAQYRIAEYQDTINYLKGVDEDEY